MDFCVSELVSNVEGKFRLVKSLLMKHPRDWKKKETYRQQRLTNKTTAHRETNICKERK
jgi:hypothetical protein